MEKLVEDSWGSNCSPASTDVFQELMNMVIFSTAAENQPGPPDCQCLLFLVHFFSFENSPLFSNLHSTNIY